MIYYLTGSNGFLAKHIEKYLIAKGEIVICHQRDKGFDRVSNCDVIINCQAYGNHHDQKLIGETIKANCIDLMDLLMACENQKIYNISTSSIGLRVQTPYSLTKHLGEMICNNSGKNVVNVRPYSLFGEGDNPNHLIPTIIRHLHSGETMQLVTEPTHDYIYVDDFIEAMFEGYTEIGSGKSYTNLEIVKLLEKISGKSLNFVQVERMREYDNEHWVCQTPVKTTDFESNLRKTYESYSQANN